MKKFFSSYIIPICLTAFMSSCFVHRFEIGNGPQTGVEVSGKNHFFLFGLIQGKSTDPQQMASKTQNYEVTEVITFPDGLVGALTLGIYTPTTTIIQK